MWGKHFLFNRIKMNTMSVTIHDLKPESVFRYFYEITQIPRPSRKEEKVIEYLEDFGKKHQLETLKDKVGNILIRKAATPGREDAPIVVLQSHMDMVCEKNADVDFNFDTDPIQTYIEDGWLKAKGTTLGADDGIGMAAMLAILAADDIKHGAIECFFTVDEETGMTGAMGLQADFLKGKVMLNLDSEDDGQFFIGCAGGQDTVIELPYEMENTPEGYTAFELKVFGLKGGHSGDDINKGLGNAVKLMNRLLWNAADYFGLRINKFNGGNLRNAIARESFALVALPNAELEKFKVYVDAYRNVIREEYRATEKELDIQLVDAALPKQLVIQEYQNALLNAIYACPHGVIEYSREIPNFVETSTNLAAITTKDDHFYITTSQRSSVDSAKHDASAMVASTFRLAGAKVQHSGDYPGWAPNPNSMIVDLSSSTFKKLFNEEPLVLAVHAGLECGLIGEKYPEMDMVSYGPTIRGAHSPEERLLIDTVSKFWELTVDILENVK